MTINKSINKIKQEDQSQHEKEIEKWFRRRRLRRKRKNDKEEE